MTITRQSQVTRLNRIFLVTRLCLVTVFQRLCLVPISWFMRQSLNPGITRQSQVTRLENTGFLSFYAAMRMMVESISTI